MKKFLLMGALTLALPVLASAQAPIAVAAVSDTSATVAGGDLEIDNCWIRLLPQSLPAGGYFKIKNKGAAATELTGVHTDAYGSSMLHQTQNAGGMSKMVMSHDIAVPAHGELDFSPGGYHMMLEKPTRKLVVGEQVHFDFMFSGMVSVPVVCEVRPANAS
jgi:copper(I)-binding protein